MVLAHAACAQSASKRPDRAHVTVSNIRPAAETLPDPAGYVRLTRSQIERAGKKLAGIGVPSPRIRLLGFWVNPDGAIIALFYDPSGRFLPMREEVRKRVGEVIPGIAPSDIIHMTIGRILHVPFSDDPAERERQMKEIRRSVRRFAIQLRKKWGTYDRDVLVDDYDAWIL